MKRQVRRLALARSTDPIKGAAWGALRALTLLVALAVVLDFVLMISGYIRPFSFTEAILGRVAGIASGHTASLMSVLLFVSIAFVISVLLWLAAKGQATRLSEDMRTARLALERARLSCNTESKCFPS